MVHYLTDMKTCYESGCFLSSMIAITYYKKAPITLHEGPLFT